MDKSKGMKKRVLVTGAKGMLGADLCTIFASHFELHGVDVDEVDVCRADSVFSTFDSFKPDLVVHLAAMTDVDACEKIPDRAYQVNTIGTQLIALACQRHDAEMVYLSSVSVFGGEKHDAYTEFDIPNPVSHYSRSTYQGALIVQSLLRRYFIVRAGWMFGGGMRDKKFVARIIELARTKPVLQIVNDKFGSPTYTCDIASGILQLINTGWYGAYNMVNTGTPASRYAVAQRILECANITSCELQPVSSAQFPMPAPRPRMEAARNLRLELLGLNLMRPWQEALQEYIADRLSG
ncbi:MAG: dTDP-4-dehydrorhamnose reductase [Chloroflexi bacterium]|nr:dTDP-4-dehydrorhamnose reductase [Chloroflexota bacterium]